ncbi:hypothetical protein [Zavarzinella formosa]|uniref:hypothetical protein n=1 Tax=Zavarzinella formosa TaxID=360055 RepID=UPI0002D64844|nr:hypothetical protein [Zavarzinella formosa]
MNSDSRNMWRKVVWLGVGLLAAGVAVQPRIAEDTWWHLAVGRWIADHGTIPETDPFSLRGQTENIPWRAYSWLFETLLFQVFQRFGLDGALMLRFLLSAASAVSVCAYLGNRTRGFWTGPVLAAIVMPAFWPLFTERPWHMTIIGVVATLRVLDQLLTRPTSLRRVIWLVPVYALWANIHIQFVLGLGLLGAGLGVALVRHRRQPAVSSVGTLLILWPLCALATLANPYHVNLYRVVWEYATQTGALSLIDELAPPRLRDWWTWPLIFLGFLAALKLLRDGFPLWETTLLAIGLFFALRMQRDAWFGTLLAARTLLRPGGAIPQPWTPIVWPALGFVLVRLLWASGLAAHQPIDDIVRREYPVEAVTWVKANRPPGPLFNTFDWGGYLIWELPEYPVSMDGRSNLYGDEQLSQHVRTLTTPDGWQTDSVFQNSRLVILPVMTNGKELPLVTELRKTWQVAYEDAAAIVFVKNE